MAKDIVLMGAEFPAVPAVELPMLGGGVARFTDVSAATALAADVKSGKIFFPASGEQALGTYLWDWRGDKVEQLDFSYSDTIKLKDTLFNGWEPDKTAKTIKATQNVGTFVADMENYGYLIKWQFDCSVAYAEGTTPMVAPDRCLAEIWQAILRRPNSLATLASKSFVGNACVTLLTVPLTIYFKGDGARTYAFTGSYAFYAGATAATFSSSTAASPTVTVKAPTVSARCSTTYMSTDMAEAIDQENSIIKRNCKLFRVPFKATWGGAYDSLLDLYANPL